MKFNFNNKKIIWLAALIIIAILAAYLFYAPAAGAAPTAVKAPGKTAGVGVGTIALAGAKIVGWGVVVYGLILLVFTFLTYLIMAAAFLLDMAFNLALRPEIFLSEPVVKGWELVRDFANVWIVLFLLGIAVATILSIKTYQAKQTLSWLIAIAILINFSLPIASMIIDFSNVLTLQFVQAIGTKAGDMWTISDKINNTLGLQDLSAAKEDIAKETEKALGSSVTPPQKTSSIGIPKAEAQAGPLLRALGGWWTTIFFIVDGLFGSPVWNGVTTIFSNTVGLLFSPASGVGQASLISMLFSIILLAAAAYVILALAVLLIIRTVVLTFLLILAPAGFALTILPATYTYGQKWWEMLIKQSLFAPALAFLLWITLSIFPPLQGAVGTSSLTFAAAPKLFVFVLAIIMLYACLLLAKHMGAVGADTAINWFGKAKGWVTGAVGGVALRNTVGRFGGLMQQAPAIQSSVFGARMSRIMTKAGARLPGGSYEDLQHERAESTMKKAEGEWAKDFMGLDTPGRVAMLSKMDDKQKDGLREDLKKISPDAGEQMFNNAMRLHFGEAALGKVDLESWKRSDQATQKNLMPYSPEVTEQILRSFPDEDARAKWMLGLTAENKNKAQGVMDTKFSTAERAKYNKAERRQEMRGKELAGGDEFDKFVNTLPADQDSNYLDSADDRQKLLWLESVNKIADPGDRDAKLQRYQNIIQTKLSQEDQDKFYRETLRRASMPTISSYVKTLPDMISKEKVIGSASSVQQAQLWMSDRPTRKIVDTAIGKQSADAQKDFHSALAREIDRKTADDIADVFSELHEETKSVIVHGNIDRNIEIIAKLAGTKPADAKEFVDIIKSAGLTTQYVKKLDPEQKVRYIDNINPATRQKDFDTAVAGEIKNTTPRELSQKLSAQTIVLPAMKKALIESGSMAQLIALVDTTAKAEAVKTIVREAVKNSNRVQQTVASGGLSETQATDQVMQDAKALQDIFETEYKNKALGQQIVELRERQKQKKSMMPALEKEFIQQIFGS